MKTLRGPRALARCLVVLALLLQGHGVAEDGASRSSIQTTMHAFFRALTSAFPWSLDEQQFQAPEHRQHILVALRALAQHAGQLDTHGQDVPQSFGTRGSRICSVLISASASWRKLRLRASPYQNALSWRWQLASLTPPSTPAKRSCAPRALRRLICGLWVSLRTISR